MCPGVRLFLIVFGIKPGSLRTVSFAEQMRFYEASENREF